MGHRLTEEWLEEGMRFVERYWLCADGGESGVIMPVEGGNVTVALHDLLMDCRMLSRDWSVYERHQIEVYIVLFLVDVLRHNIEGFGGQDIVVCEDDTRVDWPFAVPIKFV